MKNKITFKLAFVFSLFFILFLNLIFIKEKDNIKIKYVNNSDSIEELDLSLYADYYDIIITDEGFNIVCKKEYDVDLFILICATYKSSRCNCKVINECSTRNYR